MYTYDMLKKKQTYKSRFRNSGKLTSFLGWGGWGWLSRLGPGALKIRMEPKKPPILKGKSSSIFDPSTIFGFQHVNLFTTRISMERVFCWGILTTQLYMGMIYDYFINIS